MANGPDEEYIPESPDSSGSSVPPTLGASTIGHQASSSKPNSQEKQSNSTRFIETAQTSNVLDAQRPHPTSTMPSIPQLQSPSDLEERFTMSGTHEQWQAITTSTSKCDVCRENRRGILYMCRQCSRNVCTTCVQKGTLGDRKHKFVSENVVWQGPQNKPKAKPQKKATIRDRVTKPTKGTGSQVTASGIVGKRSQLLNPNPSSSVRKALGIDRCVPEAFENSSQKSNETQQAPFAQTHPRGDKVANMGNLYQAQPYHQTPLVSSEAGENEQIAASALAAMKSTSSSEDENPPPHPNITQGHPGSRPVEQHELYDMDRRPLQPALMLRPLRPGRFEPYNIDMRHRQSNLESQEERRSRARTSVVHGPSPLSRRVASLRQALPSSSQHESQSTAAPLGGVSYERSDREDSVSPETMSRSTKARSSSRSRPASSSSETSTKPPNVPASLAPMPPQPHPHQTIAAHGPLPPIRHMVQGASTISPGQPIPRSVPQGYNGGEGSRPRHPPVMSAQQAAYMARFHHPPAMHHINAPLPSPLTRQAFAPVRTISEAYGQWQIYLVHSAVAEYRETDREACLREHTTRLWTYLLNQIPYQIEETFMLVLTATWYATTRLEIRALNNKATRWLKRLQESLLAQGFAIEGSFLEQLGIDTERR